jgi:hypothetical protein
MHSAQSLLDLERYPIHQNGPARDALVSSVRTDLQKDGCAIVKGLISKDGIEALLAEAEGVSDCGFRSFNRTNAYFTPDDPSLPPEDPRRQFFDRSNTFIPADNFQQEGPLRTIYADGAFGLFIQDSLQEDRFFPYADPLADVIVNMAEAGNGFPWHFDTNNFTVTVAIQNAEEGGAFEYAPNIRQGDENFDEVAKVLNGTSDQVTSINLEPGDLQIFRGRYSLHRVAPLRGDRRRFVGIMSWVQEAGMVATPERCKQLYGKALPIHYERAGLRADSYID